MYQFVSRVFLKGLTIVLPLSVAFYAVVWLISSAEGVVKRVITSLLPDRFYIPGTGLLLVCGLVFFVGLLMHPWMTRKIIGKADSLLRRIPLFGSVYSPVKDLMELFGGDLNQKLGQPVMIRIPNTEMETLGFVTREKGGSLPDGLVSNSISPEDLLVVYVQWSFQMGGYCFILPKEHVRPVDMTVEQGMQWALTAGLAVPKPSN